MGVWGVESRGRSGRVDVDKRSTLAMVAGEGGGKRRKTLKLVKLVRFK